MRSFRVSDPGIVRHFGGPAESYAGKAVTVNGALQLSTVWACINLLANTIASLPLNSYRTDAKGNAEVDRGTPFQALLHDQPNADMTAVEFWRAMVMNLCAHGNCYAEIMRTTRRIVALYPLRPEFITVRRAETGDLVYTYHNGSAEPREIDQANILHIKGGSFDGLVGMSPISFARHTLGLAMAADEATGGLYKNGMRNAGWFKSPSILTEPQRSAAQLMMARFTGSQNAGKHPLMEGGWDFVPNAMPPADAQLLESRNFSVEEMCRWYGVPPHMVGHMDKVTSWGSGLEQQNLGFLLYVLDPYLKNVEQAVTKALVAPGDRGVVRAEYNRDAIMRADSAGRAALYSSYVQNGLRTRNEVRKLDNMPPLDGADELTAQSNLVPLGKMGVTPPAPVAPVVAPQDTKQ